MKATLALIGIPAHRDALADALDAAGKHTPKLSQRERHPAKRGTGTDAAEGGTRGSRGDPKSRSGINRYAQQLQDDLGCNDSANAALLLSKHGDGIRFVHDWGKWLLWDNDVGVWCVDAMDYMQELATGIGEMLRRAAHDEADTDCQGWRLKHARSTLSTKGKLDLLTAAKTHPDVAITTEHLDAHPHLLNVRNGTLDLRLESLGSANPLKPPLRENLLTQQSPVKFEPEATCPLFRAHLDCVFEHDEAMVAFMLRFLGHCLLSGNPEQQLAIFWGSGANGKSTLLNAVKHVIGDYAATLDTDVLMSSNRGGNNQLYELACLRGARLVTASETEQGDTLKASLVKTLTGGDDFRAREPYGAPFSVKATFIPVMATNNKPRITDGSYGMWRRVLLVPFTYEIPRADWIDDYDKLLVETESPGILNLMLDGLLDYLERRSEGKPGLAPPERVLSETLQYRTEQDILAEFIKDCVETKDEHLIIISERVTQPLLRTAYENWCDGNAREPVQKRTFNRHVREHFGEPAKSGSSRFWRGVVLTELGHTFSAASGRQEGLYDR